MTTKRSYAYMLRDPNCSDYRKSIFYVGKATGLRPLDHAQEAREEIKRLRLEATSQAQKKDLDAKLSILEKLDARGQQPEIEVLAGVGGKPLSPSEALMVEAALIAALRMVEYGNKVSGHHLRMLPSNVFQRARKSRMVQIPSDSLVVAVPVSNVWGGTDYSGGLLAASRDAVWANAHRLWSPIAARRVDEIVRRAKTSRPVVLLALESNPFRRNEAIVVGVEHLASAYQSKEEKSGRRKDGTPVPPYKGWKFRRATEEAQWVTKLRKKLLYQAPVVDGVVLTKPQDRCYPGWS